MVEHCPYKTATGVRFSHEAPVFAAIGKWHTTTLVKLYPKFDSW